MRGESGSFQRCSCDIQLDVYNNMDLKCIFHATVVVQLQLIYLNWIVNVCKSINISFVNQLHNYNFFIFTLYDVRTII